MARNQTNGSPDADITIDETDPDDMNPDCTVTVLGVTIVKRYMDYPLVTRVNGFKRQLKHIYGNEPAAKVGLKIDEVLGLPEGTSDEDIKAARAKYREENREAYMALVQEAIDNQVAMLMRGELSADERIRVNPVDRMYFTIVDNFVAAQLKGAKGADGKALKAPTNDKDLLEFGNGMTRSRKQLRDTIIAREGHEALMEQAKAAVAAQAATRATPAPVEPVNDPAALGF